MTQCSRQHIIICGYRWSVLFQPIQYARCWQHTVFCLSLYYFQLWWSTVVAPPHNCTLPETQYGTRLRRGHQAFGWISPRPHRAFGAMGGPMKEGAYTPGCTQCPKQTGRNLGAHGSWRRRGRGSEYDRRGKYSLYLGNELLPKMSYPVSGVAGRASVNNAHPTNCPTTLPKQLLQNLYPASCREGEIHFRHCYNHEKRIMSYYLT